MGCPRALPALACAVLAFVANGDPPAFANDTTAELAVGGLVFTRNADVSIESEELTITPDTVKVRYIFLNQTPAPVTATIAFPMPDIDLSEADNYAIPTDDPVNFIAFETTIDGKPAPLEINQRAFLGDKDVSAVVKGAGAPILPIGSLQNRVAELPKTSKDRLIAAGLLIPAGTDAKGGPLHSGSWTVKTAVMRQQTFPPDKPVVVEHRYRTSMGLSFDTVLRKALRDNKAMDQEVKRYRAAYCISDTLLRGIDRVAGNAEGNTARLRERRISYILKTGANWAGPIKDFKLVIDKGRPERLVSFCMDNIKKVSSTAFEVRIKDFTPTHDLKILLVGTED
jgi:hypothetical protein